MDMHSGGPTKEPPYEYIYIEATEAETPAIFYGKFGHSVERVSCTCCGQDYSLSESDTFAAATAYNRRCRWIEDRRGWGYTGADRVEGHYIEDGEEIPEGYVDSRSSAFRRGEYLTVAQYRALPTVLVIPASEIRPEWRTADVPEQGYVWRD